MNKGFGKKLNKKGFTLLTWIFEILAVLLVIFILTSTAEAFGNSDTVFKINLAEDIRMMLNTLAGVPGAAVVTIPYNLSGYNLILSRNSITVFKEGDPETKKITRTFFLPEGYSSSGVIDNLDTVCIEKQVKTEKDTGTKNIEDNVNTENSGNIGNRQTNFFLKKCEFFPAVKATLASTEPEFYGIPITGDKIVFVIDHSGSMREDSEWKFSGLDLTDIGNRKIDVAKWQLRNALERIPEGKKFNIIFFDNSIKIFKTSMVELTPAARKEAIEFISPYEPGTGTNAYDALTQALSYDTDSIYFLTDGLPNKPTDLIINRVKLLNAVRNAKINAIGVFSGIPADASKYQLEIRERDLKLGAEFLQQLAEDSGGIFVAQLEEQIKK